MTTLVDARAVVRQAHACIGRHARHRCHGAGHALAASVVQIVLAVWRARVLRQVGRPVLLYHVVLHDGIAVGSVRGHTAGLGALALCAPCATFCAAAGSVAASRGRRQSHLQVGVVLRTRLHCCAEAARKVLCTVLPPGSQRKPCSVEPHALRLRVRVHAAVTEPARSGNRRTFTRRQAAHTRSSQGAQTAHLQ
jgi:hypothetical protein